MRKLRATTLRRMAALAVGASMLQLGGVSLDSCTPGGVVNYFTNTFNPCFSILACDPATYRFLTSGYNGPGVDPDVDPACTYPPYCAGDPFVQTPGGP